MITKYLKFSYLTSVLLCLLLFNTLVLADTERDKADYAVGNILFEYEIPDGDGASYAIKNNGHVRIQFAENIPDDLYEEVLTALKSHPDINGVLSGKGLPACIGFIRR